MSTIFFTSDTHFYHYNSIKHNNRPYSGVEEMNQALIDFAVKAYIMQKKSSLN